MLPHVARWFDTNTFTAATFSLQQLVAAKCGQRISVVLPARNEQDTIGAIIDEIARTLVGEAALVDEVVVMDSQSSDSTARVAAAAGATVAAVDKVLAELGSRDGKGEALWKSLAVTTGDIVVFLDADLRNFTWHWVIGLLGPLLTRPDVCFVKAAYDRVLDLDGHRSSTGGGRLTELVARPLLNAHWPQLAGMIQPLAGEYAGRREVLQRIPFACGYGVELAMLIDLLGLVGLSGLAQVDLGSRVHRNRPDAELVPAATAIWHAAARRLGVETLASSALTTFARNGDGYAPATIELSGEERPPWLTVRPTVSQLVP